MAASYLQHHLPYWPGGNPLQIQKGKSVDTLGSSHPPARSGGIHRGTFSGCQNSDRKIGAAICYDWLFPECLRQLTANGAEVPARVSAYMDPFGTAEPMDWWTTVNRCRALENTAYVVAANQGASLKHYPPFSWPGGSMVVDYDGRVVTQASPGPGERIVVAPINIDMLRYERKTRRAHQMLAHLRSESYSFSRMTFYSSSNM